MQILLDSQREVVVMLKVTGMSVQEVALATGSTPAAVKQKAYRAYQTIRNAMGILDGDLKRTAVMSTASSAKESNCANCKCAPAHTFETVHVAAHWSSSSPNRLRRPTTRTIPAARLRLVLPATWHRPNHWPALVRSLSRS
ncbi:MAG: hypothetical protein FJW36_04180 [Acidobacteria bacterium]|nr:hypothetical protein [Acidobacteriota bacterium]